MRIRKNNNLEKRKKKCWVFKSFLKVERDAPALVVLGSSFHQRGTTNENSLDCRACMDGSAERRSLDERFWCRRAPGKNIEQTHEGGVLTKSTGGSYLHQLQMQP